MSDAHMNQLGSEAGEAASPNYQQTHPSDESLRLRTNSRETGGRTKKCPEASERKATGWLLSGAARARVSLLSGASSRDELRRNLI